jgi:hypothetical protein
MRETCVRHKKHVRLAGMGREPLGRQTKGEVIPTRWSGASHGADAGAAWLLSALSKSRSQSR